MVGIHAGSRGRLDSEGGARARRAARALVQAAEGTKAEPQVVLYRSIDEHGNPGGYYYGDADEADTQISAADGGLGVERVTLRGEGRGRKPSLNRKPGPNPRRGNRERKRMSERTTTLGQGVLDAATLDALLAALLACEAETREHNLAAQTEGESPWAGNERAEDRHGYDVTALPDFGGTEPWDTSGIYSWDADRILVADGTAWAIEDREPADDPPDPTGDPTVLIVQDPGDPYDEMVWGWGHGEAAARGMNDDLDTAVAHRATPELMALLDAKDCPDLLMPHTATMPNGWADVPAIAIPQGATATATAELLERQLAPDVVESIVASLGEQVAAAVDDDVDIRGWSPLAAVARLAEWDTLPQGMTGESRIEWSRLVRRIVTAEIPDGEAVTVAAVCLGDGEVMVRLVDDESGGGLSFRLLSPGRDPGPIGGPDPAPADGSPWKGPFDEMQRKREQAERFGVSDRALDDACRAFIDAGTVDATVTERCYAVPADSEGAVAPHWDELRELAESEAHAKELAGQFPFGGHVLHERIERRWDYGGGYRATPIEAVAAVGDVP